MVEVLKHAPDALTWRERYALVVLAENAKDGTRQCWPGIEDDPEIAHRMRLPGRSSRYEVLKALRTKGALESVMTGHRGRRAVYRIPVMGPETPDAIDPEMGPESSDAMAEKGPESPDKGSGNDGPNPDAKGPGTTDPNGEKGSGNDRERVREPHGKGPGIPDPYSSDPSNTPQQQEAAPTTDSNRQITVEEKLEFGRFWQLHPKSRAMDKTKSAWASAVLSGVDPKKITAAAEAYAHEMKTKDWQFIKQSDHWIREHRYEDKFPPRPNSKPSGQLPPWCGECADGNRAAERNGHLRQIYDHNGNGRPCPKCHPDMTHHGHAA